MHFYAFEKDVGKRKQKIACTAFKKDNHLRWLLNIIAAISEKSMTALIPALAPVIPPVNMPNTPFSLTAFLKSLIIQLMLLQLLTIKEKKF